VPVQLPPQFPANTWRTDPYKNFRFRVNWDGRYVAGVSKISALKRTTEVIKFRDGGMPPTQFHMPGQSAFESVTLERGVTQDKDFEAWANLVYDQGAGGFISLKNFRKDIIIELRDEDDRIAKVYKLYRCWVSEYQALPELDANANAVAIEHMKIETEGWERDASHPEPDES
jgi:phage tail-like protein